MVAEKNKKTPRTGCPDLGALAVCRLVGSYAPPPAPRPGGLKYQNQNWVAADFITDILPSAGAVRNPDFGDLWCSRTGCMRQASRLHHNGRGPATALFRRFRPKN
jgi:hypothetical protein